MRPCDAEMWKSQGCNGFQRVAHEHKWLPCTSQSLQRKRVIPAGDTGITWPSLKKNTWSHGKGTA